MKLRYKLILIFVVIIIIATLPLTLFIVQKNENEKISLLTEQGMLISKITANSIVNILLMNGGEIDSSRIDAKELLQNLKPLKKEGLIYADAILVSSRKGYNGLILGRYADKNVANLNFFNNQKISDQEIEKLSSRNESIIVTVPGYSSPCYEFIGIGNLQDGTPLSICRLYFNESIVLNPIKRLRWFLYFLTGLAIVVVSVIGLIFSRYLSKPIDRLNNAARRIEGGDFSVEIPVFSKDEIGVLSKTFNHMTQIINLKIAELVETNKRLTELDNLKDDFLANVAYELRSPISSIIGLAESMISGVTGELGEASKNDLSLIVKSGKRLSNLVNDILDFSRLKHRDILLKKTAVYLSRVAEFIRTATEPLIGEKDVVIYNRVPDDLPPVLADSDRVAQILLNLVTNSIKFTDSGSISISAEIDEYNDSLIIIRVSDTGSGITTELQEKIFDTFEVSSGVTGVRHGAPGFGLAITKYLVELHGGDIELESEPGKGTAVSFTLERAVTWNDTVSDLSMKFEKRDIIDFSHDDIGTDRVNNLKNQEDIYSRIMIIDDEPVNLQVLINHLALEEYSVVTYDNGSEALLALDENQVPDLVIIDVMLPKMSGYEVCKEIRKNFSLLELPVLLMTTRSKPYDIISGIEAGANDYLTKPVNREELLVRVQNLVHLKKTVKVQDELNVIKKELNIAHEIIRTILPEELPSVKNFKIAVRYQPMKEVGGDFYDFQDTDSDRLGVLIADVSGHGVPAAIVCAMLQVAYSFYKMDDINPSILLNKINTIMCNYSHGRYTTASYITINLINNKLYYSNAGHRPLLIWRRSEKQLIKVKLHGSPVGLFEDGKFSLKILDVHKGDRIILYTDGLIEFRDLEKNIYGEENLIKSIRRFQDLPAEEFTDKIIASVREWSGFESTGHQDDDLTLIVIDIL